MVRMGMGKGRCEDIREGCVRAYEGGYERVCCHCHLLHETTMYHD